MKLPTLRTALTPAIRVALAIACYCTGLHAANVLTAAPAIVALTCNTATGPGAAATIVVKPVAALTTTSLTVAFGIVAGGVVVTAPSTAILNSTNQTAGLTYTVRLAAGCAGAVTTSVPIRFYAGVVPDVIVTANTSVTATSSGLAAAPVALTCIRNAGTVATYTPGSAQTALVTSSAAGGTPFTVDTAGNPAWLSVTPVSGGLANSAGVSLTVSAVAPCGSFAVASSNSASIRLKNAPAPDSVIPVTLQIVNPTPLVATPALPSIAYTKGSGIPASADVALTMAGTSTATFSVDSTTLPAWLTVDALTGPLPKTLHFTTTSVADSIAQGIYSITIRIRVAGYADLSVPFRLTLSNPAPKLLVSDGNTRDLVWTIGQPLPVPFITLSSSGSTIPYTLVTGGPLAPVIAPGLQKGLVYSYDTPIPVTFSPSVFATVQAGNVLTGTVSITWGTPATTTVVTFTITAQAPGAVLTALSPSTLPTTLPSQTFTVALSGTGFVASSDPTQRTVVGVVFGGSLIADANLAATVINPSNIILAITVPATADPLLPFSPTGAGGVVMLGVCNPQGGICTVPTSTVKLTIGAAPFIQAVSSASTFLQVTPPALPTVAPYDMISLFGTNFCMSGGTGCTANQLLHGTPDPVTRRFSTSLSPDAADVVQRVVTVTFQTHASPPALIATAPLLFATNGQINLLVPSALSAYVGRSVDIVVSFGVPVAASMLSSAPFAVNVAAVDPGILTVGSDGQGDGAILDLDWSIIGSGNEAGLRAVAADSDLVQIYMTGLGAPDSSADPTRAGTGLWPADCASVSGYLSTLNWQAGTLLTALDGVVIDSALLGTGHLAPCLRSTTAIPTVTVGGQLATVTYAGWVADTVAGQYQVNVRLPANSGIFTTASGTTVKAPLKEPVRLPVVVTGRGVSSQPGVTLLVAPRLKLTGPAASGLHGVAGAAWPASAQLTASQGSVPYQYTVTAGVLPAGLTLDTTSGLISGTPVAASKGSYAITATATDAAAPPLTGSATFLLTVE